MKDPQLGFEVRPRALVPLVLLTNASWLTARFALEEKKTPPSGQVLGQIGASERESLRETVALLQKSRRNMMDPDPEKVPFIAWRGALNGRKHGGKAPCGPGRP